MSEEDIQKRLRELETKVALLERHDEERDKDLDKIQTGISRALWVIGGGLLAAVTSWIAGGGLAK